MTITLSQEEIEELTGYMRPLDQLEDLRQRGFIRAFRCRKTGKVILERAHYLAVCRGEFHNQQKTSGLPNMSFINNPKRA